MPDRRRALRALIVEDDEHILRLVKTVLVREGFIVEGVGGGDAAIELLKLAAYDLLIIDLVLPALSGDHVLAYLEETQPHTLQRVVLTTASPGRLSCEFLQRICKILEKPFDIDRLILIARECAAPDPALTELPA